MENSHINESILSEEILEDQKKNRIDHMTYLPGMEDIGSDVMDQVISAMNAYDYEKYTEADVRRAIAHDIRTPEDFAALLSPAALPLLEEIAQAAQAKQGTKADTTHSAHQCTFLCIYTIREDPLMPGKMQGFVFVGIVSFLENGYIVCTAFVEICILI